MADIPDILMHSIVCKSTQHAGGFMTIILHCFNLMPTVQSTVLISLISSLFSKDFNIAQSTHNIYVPPSQKAITLCHKVAQS